MATRDEVEQHAAAVHRRDAANAFRLVVIIVAIAALVAIGMDNRHEARIGYVVGDTSAPVWVVVVAAAVVGMVIGWLLRHRPRQRS